MRARLQARRSLPWLWSAGCGFALAVVLLGVARRTAPASSPCEGADRGLFEGPTALPAPALAASVCAIMCRST